jgi:ABC-type uncharacterized transport system permease subunit
MNIEFIADLIRAALIAATPIALGSFGGLFSERSGIVNIAIEGMMLTSAMVGAFVAASTGSLFLGLVLGLTSAGLMAALHALVSIRFKTDQIISGTVINFLALGLTGHIYQVYLADLPDNWPGFSTFPQIPIPVLSEIPFIGKAFFNHQPLVYITIILAIVIHFVLFNTPWGLRMRAVGEHPKAADTVGINVYFTRYANVIIGGLLAGLGGIWLTLEFVGQFSINMTAGRGFIALAALIFGRWTPFGAYGAALLFGFFGAVALRGQSTSGAAAELWQILPYALTIVVAAISRPIPPAAVGKPYEVE